MADNPQSLSAITSALAQLYRPQVTRQINRRSVLLRLLPIRVSDTAKNVAFDIEGDGAIAENFSDGADASNFGSDALQPVTLPFGLVRSNFRITDQAKAAARTVNNPSALSNLFMRNATNSVAKLASTINGQLYTGTGSSNQLAGFKQVVLRDDNIYGGIDRTDSANSHWRSNVIDAAGAPLSLKMIRDAVGVTIYNASGEQPTVGMCPPAVFNYVGSLYDSNRRYQNDIARTIQTPRGEVVLDSSIGVIDVEGLTLIKDKDAPATEIQLLNLDHLAVEYINMVEDELIPEKLVQMGADDGYGAIPLGMHLKRIATLGASSRFSLQAYLQLACDRPNACGRLTNFTMP